jgi:hypothetical protein
LESSNVVIGSQAVPEHSKVADGVMNGDHYSTNRRALRGWVMPSRGCCTAVYVVIFIALVRFEFRTSVALKYL